MEPLAPNPDVVYETIDDELVLVDLQTNRVYTLNETGARIWELICAGADRRRLEDALRAEFDVSPAQLQEELEELLQSLLDEGLLQSPSS